MRFLFTAGSGYSAEDKYVDILENAGVEIEKEKAKATDNWKPNGYYHYIQIETIGQLKEITDLCANEHSEAVIVDFSYMTIEIYDNYVE